MSEQVPMHSPEQTVALLSPEDCENITLNMDHPKSALKLGAGKTLEEQCNDNYGYLNSRGISMSQFNGVLESARAACQAAKSDDSSTNYIKRSDGGIETIGYRQFLDGGQVNPITGKLDLNNGQNYFTANNSPEESLGLWMGFSDIEAEAAKVGVFGAKEAYDVPGSCRAEQILLRLGATETGQRIVAEQGIGTETPEQPIALAEVPLGPTPREMQQAREAEAAQDAELANVRLTAELTDTLRAIKATASPGQIEATKLPGGGKRYRIQIGEEPKEFTGAFDGVKVTYSEGSWVEVAEPKKGRPSFRIFTAKKFNGDGGYRFDGIGNRDYRWEEGGKSQVVYTTKGSVKLSDEKKADPVQSDLEYLRTKIVAPNQARVEQAKTMQTQRASRIGSLATRLFSRRS